MIFTNVRSQHSYIGNQIQQSKHITPQTNLFSIIMNPRPIPQKVIPSTTELNPPPPPTQKKMKWGEPTWYLLHCLAEKVREEYFYSMREELLNVIYSICSNLPCPDCAKHASDYLNSINYKLIQSKEQLKNVLFQFHNNVNIKKNMPVFPRDQLEQKYRDMPFISTIYIFMEHFQDKHKSIRMIANDFYRARLSDNLKAWFNANITKFNL